MNFRMHGAVLLMALALSACGAKIVKNAPPPPVDRIVAEAGSPHMQAQLTWVLVSEGPGSWAEEAVWDEYLIRVRNTSSVPVEINSVVVEDSSGQAAVTMDSRSALIQASKQTAKRYKEQGISVYTGLGSAGMTALGVGSTVAGMAYGSTLALGFAGGASSSSLALGTAFGLVVTGPVLGTIGVVRATRAHKMNKRIQARNTPLPLALAPGEERMLDVFFPITPAPNRVSISYRQDDAEHRIDIDTRRALAGLHLPPLEPVASDQGAGAAPEAQGAANAPGM
ncbi:hypothetical protein ACFPOA_02585 [Lysobacter niabensis]|uniref:hypothetical protein n=1 Tax=Agrilutibacter niabensis TaxID=380628 RepID=UPI0036081FEB